jgi:hypothetical protein
MISRDSKLKIIEKEIQKLETLLTQKKEDKERLIEKQDKIFSSMFSAEFAEYITKNYNSPLCEIEKGTDSFLGIVGIFESHEDAAGRILEIASYYWDDDESVLGEFKGKEVILVQSLNDGTTSGFGIEFSEASETFVLSTKL